MAVSLAIPIPPFHTAPEGSAAGAALLARVLPTNEAPQIQSSFASQAAPQAQGTTDTFTAQYAPETYAVALVSEAARAVEPTYGGTNIPYFDHELQKIEAAYQGNATLTPPLPTFAAQAVEAARSSSGTQ